MSDRASFYRSYYAIYLSDSRGPLFIIVLGAASAWINMDCREARVGPWLFERRGRLRRRAHGTALLSGQRPNELWCTDYEGEFLLGNRQYCYPLTVTDHASRYLLVCEALSSTEENYASTVFERLFKERGLPAILTRFSPGGRGDLRCHLGISPNV